MDNPAFTDLNLTQEVLRAVTEMGFEEATPIQAQSIPPILEGRDVVGQARTGTGKTCAFGIPAVETADPEAESIQVLVLCPTRELTIQTAEELSSVAKYKRGIRILPVYGGQPIERQLTALRRRPQIVIGTPGRVMDHMRRRTIRLSNLRMIVLDEADEMLDMGFREDIDTILKEAPAERQTILFSATIPQEIMDLTSHYQKDPVIIKAVHKELTVPGVEQYYLEVREPMKMDVLSRLLDAQDIKLSLVFCNTKRRVDELTSALQSRGYSAEGLHGDMNQAQRDKVMGRFRKGDIDVLIATDVAARGLDVNNVEAVFNYDVPKDEEFYVHRIGRTGRAGKAGKAFTFVAGRELYKLREIQRYTKSTIHLQKPPTLMDVEESKIGKVLGALKDTISQGQLAKYVSYIEKMLEEEDLPAGSEGVVTTLDVAAALLKMATAQTQTPISADTAMGRPPERPDARKGMARFFISAGRIDGIQPRHIVDSIAANTRIPGRKVGDIDIHERYSFVEVPQEYAGDVVPGLADQRLMGRRLNVKPADRKLRRGLPAGRPKA